MVAATRLAVRVAPGASSAEVAGRYGAEWKVGVSARADRGRHVRRLPALRSADRRGTARGAALRHALHRLQASRGARLTGRRPRLAPSGEAMFPPRAPFFSDARPGERAARIAACTE